MKNAIALKLGILLILAKLSACQYVSLDDPPCRDDCDSVSASEKNECLKEYSEFYSYKMVKSLFNFAKISVYAGLWNTRYEKADQKLFENVFMRTLSKYNDVSVLGNVRFEDLNKTALHLYKKLEQWTLKRKPTDAIPYETYPSLKCPTPCDYELLTWQTLFYVSIAIFVLALFTVLFYSVFLRKQYVSLRNRFKKSKKANIES